MSYLLNHCQVNRQWKIMSLKLGVKLHFWFSPFFFFFFSWSLTVSSRNNIIFDVSLCKRLFLGDRKKSGVGETLAPPATCVRGRGREGDDTQRDPTLSGPQREEGGEMRLGLPAAWASKLRRRLLDLLVNGAPGQRQPGKAKRTAFVSHG